jgi:adenylate cyclase class 2
MPRQIEIKILEVDVDEVIRELTKMNAEIEFDGILYSIYFDDNEKRFSEGGDTLRLRQANDLKTIAYKEHVSKEHAKVKDLVEVKIGDIEHMQILLEGLGYFVLAKSEKRRSEFSIGSIYFNIDSYADIPSYLEVEGSDLAAIKKKVLALGFETKDMKPWSVRDVFEHYNKL